MKNDYYVYGHYLKEDGSLFYVGKGRKNRRLSTTGRSTGWKQITNSKEWFSKIIKGDLTNTEALQLEQELISSNSNLINRMQSTKTKDIPREVLDYFYYDESSPSCLYWKKPVVGNNGRVYKSVGEVAGIQKDTSDNKNKRWIVRFLGHSYYVHRLVYSLHYELSTDLVVDHIDGNALNNKIINLRLITQEMNTRNTKKETTNQSTGFVGVSKVQRKRLSYPQYVATWYEGGTLRMKEFSANLVTEEVALESAIKYRQQKIKELNEQGAGYTERHGT